ncbi:MAG TPA: hypothetical protein VFH27_11390, partial [Longimicrobiaceae bacterium]|nr:hypothetical protein [Longimicrobiaceae bacterium]
EYAFRSIDKDVTSSLPRDLQNTLADRVIQDQTRAQLPGSVLAVQALEQAAGVLHVDAHLYVMPDDPALGEFRAEFAGMLGAMEERPGADGAVPFGTASQVSDTDVMEAALLSGPAERVDARDYLNVRLFDLFINDWDRHEEQYSWARYDAPDGGHTWRPLPRDRDWALDDFDGRLMPFARGVAPKLVRLLADYPESLTGLIINAQFLDRRLLGPLPRPAWDSVTAALQARLSDRAIDGALAQLPDEYRALYGDFLRMQLRGRRDHLPEVAARFYGILAAEAEVHATDRADFAQAVRYADGSLELSIAPRGEDGGEKGAAWFTRRFVPGETREVRLYLHGGADRFVGRGVGSGITVRVMPDSGADVVENSGSGPVRVYTTEAEDRVAPGEGISVQRHSWKPEPWKRGDPTAPIPREWGRTKSNLSPAPGWISGAGPMIGIGPTFKRWGFRRAPYASVQSIQALWAPLDTRFGVRYRGEFHMESVRTSLNVEARVTDLEADRFYGFGNDVPRPADHAVIWQRGAVGEARLNLPLARRLFLSTGPTVRWLDPVLESGTAVELTRPRGSGAFTVAGAGADLQLTPADGTGYPRTGALATVGVMAFPVAHGAGVGQYGDGHALLRAYLSPPGAWWPTLALRAGGRQLWGDFPFQDAASIGGWNTLRGYRTDRFTGDAAAWGSGELRVPVMRANLGVRGDLGVLGLTDAGRVWMDGASPGGWHTAYGGGVWFSFLDRTRTASLVWAHGERGALYAHLAIPF